MSKVQEEVLALHARQIRDWPLLKGNWEKLDATEIREIGFDGFRILVQFNPKRITSSAAKVDKTSIEKRPCFLCTANRPPEERHLEFGGDYEIMCNPFPIFRYHFTIVGKGHTPQVIGPEFGRLLDLSQALPDLVVFYNAPSCGASAPDHMHFQAGERGFMPLERELEGLKNRFGRVLPAPSGLEMNAVDDGLRRFILLESKHREALIEAFKPLNALMQERSGGKEAMLNILVYFREHWQVVVFPREVHRPWQYFEEGEKNILLSPAAVDMGGCLITPLEKDFRKIRREDIADIFGQICLSPEVFNEWVSIATKQP
jgi:hypothetical protein